MDMSIILFQVNGEILQEYTGLSPIFTPPYLLSDGFILASMTDIQRRTFDNKVSDSSSHLESVSENLTPIFSLLLEHLAILTELANLRLVGGVGARNYMRSSFSQWALSTTRT